MFHVYRHVKLCKLESLDFSLNLLRGKKNQQESKPFSSVAFPPFPICTLVFTVRAMSVNEMLPRFFLLSPASRGHVARLPAWHGGWWHPRRPAVATAEGVWKTCLVGKIKVLWLQVLSLLFFTVSVDLGKKKKNIDECR